MTVRVRTGIELGLGLEDFFEREIPLTFRVMVIIRVRTFF